MKNLRETSRLVLALQLASVAVCLVGSAVSDHPLAFSGSVATKRCVQVHPTYMAKSADEVSYCVHAYVAQEVNKSAALYIGCMCIHV